MSRTHGDAARPRLRSDLLTAVVGAGNLDRGLPLATAPGFTSPHNTLAPMESGRHSECLTLAYGGRQVVHDARCG